MTAPCWGAPSAWSAAALPQAQAQHTIASARQAMYATVRRSGPALITFRARREEKVAPHAPEPGTPLLRAGHRLRGAGRARGQRPAGTTGARAGASWAGRGLPLTRTPGAAGTAST